MTVTRTRADLINIRKNRRNLWVAMRGYKIFTIRDLEIVTGYHPTSILHYLKALMKAKYVRVLAQGGPFRPAKYELIRDAIEPPRVRPDGAPVTQGQGRENMWRAARILKNFSLADLVAAASTEEHKISAEEAKTYCGYLTRAGYLRKANKEWVFIKSTGPKAPQVQRVHQVWDSNLEEVVWPINKQKKHPGGIKAS